MLFVESQENRNYKSKGAYKRYRLELVFYLTLIMVHTIKKSIIPANEKERMDALRKYNFNFPQKDEQLETIVSVIANIF